MSLSTVLFFFLAHLGVGIAFTLVFVSKDAGVKFFRFNAGLAAILVAVALAFRYGAFGAVAVARSETEQAALLALDMSEAALIMYWATVGRMLARIRWMLVTIAVGGGVVATIAEAFAAAAGRGFPMRVLTAASFLSSAALLGGAVKRFFLAMVYPSVPIRALPASKR